MIRVSAESFDPGAVLKEFERSASEAGAIVSFTGKVRASADGERITSLHLEHYPGVTEASITQIAAQARRRWPIDEPVIVHRTGALAPGEPIMMVCVSAVHRRAAFEAADFLMDYLKTKALFWKKEIRDGEEYWIEPCGDDYKDAARWEQTKEMS